MVVEYVSLDGVIQAPGHAGEDQDGGFTHGGWTGRFMADHGRRNSQLFPAASAFLLGRRTYEIFAAYWPAVTDEDLIARALNGRPKYVVSSTLGEATWPGTTVLAGDVAGQVAELKKEPGGPILVLGSSRLVPFLLSRGLVDEYQLWLHPVVLGGGKRMFDDSHGNRLDLALVDSTATGSGLVILTYQPA